MALTKLDTLKRRIEVMRRKKPNGKYRHLWVDVCEKLGITDEHGDPYPALGYQIMKGYRPNEATCKRIGIDYTCHECGRRRLATPRARVRVELSDAEIWWRALRKDERREYKELVYGMKR